MFDVIVHPDKVERAVEHAVDAGDPRVDDLALGVSAITELMGDVDEQVCQFRADFYKSIVRTHVEETATFKGDLGCCCGSVMLPIVHQSMHVVTKRHGVIRLLRHDDLGLSS